MEFKDKIVVITGAGSGIGKACAIMFSELGATTILVDLDKNASENVAKFIRKKGHKSEAFEMDVTDCDNVETIFNQVFVRCGKIDVLINNAGIMNQKRTPTADHDIDDWHRVISVNQTGVFYCLKVALGLMMRQGHGNIVNMASLAGLKASGFNLAYSASKFAVVGMTKSAAMEYAPHNIRINAVCPSYTQTPMLDAVVEKQPGIDKKLLKYVPMGRFAEAEEIAEAVVWLASDKSKFITGETITLDGGLSL